MHWNKTVAPAVLQKKRLHPLHCAEARLDHSTVVFRHHSTCSVFAVTPREELNYTVGLCVQCNYSNSPCETMNSPGTWKY